MVESVFRARLVMLRKEQHLTQGQMAEKLGVSRPSYTCYELGHSIPGIMTLCKIADLFHVNLDYLVGRSEDPRMETTDQRAAMQETALIDMFRNIDPSKRDKVLDMFSLFL